MNTRSSRAVRAHDNTPERLYAAAVINDGTAYYGRGMHAPCRDKTGELVAILDATLTRFEPHATIVIDGVRVEQHAAQASAVAEAGWTHTTVGPWTHYTRDGRTVSVGLRDDMSPNHFGTLLERTTDPGVLAALLQRFYDLTGYAWHGTPATTALAALRVSWENSRGEPRWKHAKVGPGYASERIVWSRSPNEWEASWGYFHTFDVNAQYLAAAINAEVAWSELLHTGARLFDPRYPGYWLLDLDNATIEALRDTRRPPLLSHALKHGQAWLTTPMVKLLCDLGHRAEVVDSWTASDTRNGRTHTPGARVFARWGNQMRDARVAADQIGARSLVDAVKRTYTDCIGGMQKEGMLIYRPDWAHHVIDLARANLYRRMVRVKAAEGVWPVAVNADAVTYADCSGRGATLAHSLGVDRCTVGCGCADAGRGMLGSFKHTAIATAEEWAARDARPARPAPAARRGGRRG